jgi:hypothetical protein
MTPSGEPRTLRAITVVGVLVLLLATINFVNLKTARATQRAVEVGVRKACGAARRDLRDHAVTHADVGAHDASGRDHVPAADD